MKKRRTKLRKFLLRSLLFLLLIVGMAAVFLRSRTVQTVLAQKAAKWLSKELKTKVSIRAFEFDFFSNAHLEGVYMADRHGDTMLAAEVLEIGYQKYNGDIRRIDFSSIEFKQGNIHIGYYEGEKDKNIQFLVDYVNGPQQPKGTSQKPWTLYFSSAKLTDSRFVNFDKAKMDTHEGLMDEFNLQFNHINGQLKDLWVIDDSLHFISKHLETKERSGLTIKDFKAICNVHYKGMDFTDVDMQLACSHLKGELHFKYPGYNYLDEFVSNTQWNGKLQKTELCLSELSIFDEAFKGHAEKLDVRSIKITGTYDHLRLTGADVKMGNQTVVNGDFYIEGMPDWRTAYCDFNIRKFNTNAYELGRLLNGMEMPQLLHDAGYLSATGHFTGRFLNFRWKGDVTSSFGDLHTDAAMDFEHGYKDAAFAGHIQSDGFDLGIINENMGICSFDADLDGKGLDKSSFDLSIKSTFPKFIIRGREFTDANIQGDLTAKNFKGIAVFNDVRLNSDFDGTIDFTGKKPIFNFKANTRGIDLYALNLDTTHTLIWGNYTINAEGINPDDISGSALLENVALQRNGKVHQFRKQWITKTGGKEFTSIKFDGDFISGNIDGRISLENVEAIAVNSMADVFPDRIKSIPYQGMDSFAFDLRIPETGLICSYINPELKTGALIFKGNFLKPLGTGSFNLQPVNVEYGDLKFTQLEVNSKLSPNSGLDFSVSASEMLNSGEKQFLNLSAKGNAKDGCADYNLKLSDRTDQYHLDIISRSEFFKDSITFFPGRSRLILGNEIWFVTGESQLTLMNDNRLLCRELFLDGKDHYVQAWGTVSSQQSDTLTVDFGNFRFHDLSPFLPASSLDSLGGRMNGTLNVSGLIGSPRFTGEIIARGLKYYSQDFGDANISLSDRNTNALIVDSCRFVRGPLRDLDIRGSVGYKKIPGQQQLALAVNIPQNTPLTALQPFFKDIFTIKEGTMQGQVTIGGDGGKPRLDGNAQVRNAKIKIDYLNTNYIFNADFIANSQGFFTTHPAILKDEFDSGKAIAKLAITHQNFDNFYMDLRIDNANNLKVLNTTAKQNDLYYGTAYADGNCRIYGPFDKISMDIHLKNRKNSRVNLLYSDVEQNEIMGFVKFVNKRDTIKSKDKKVKSNSLNRIDIALDVNPDLDAEFLIDKQLGDVIKGNGNGSLRMVYDENENFWLYGTYVVQGGDYVYSLPGINVLTRKIALKKGGTISWSGDPFNAILNMTGSFTKRISPAAIMAVGSSPTQKSYSPIKIESNLFLKGNLFSPDISFDIRAPELETSGGGDANDVYRVIQRIRADKDETTRQAISLLLFGSFITPSFAQGSSSGAVISGSGVAGNSLSSIASSVVNDIFVKLGIPTRILVNIDDVKNSEGKTNTKVFINSEWFLSERIRLDLNYDPTMAMLVSNVKLPLNFNLEYMTRNENWRIKAFSRSNNLLLQQNNTTLTQGVSGNTMGAGVVYKREFDTFRPKSKPKDSTNNVVIPQPSTTDSTSR